MRPGPGGAGGVGHGQADREAVAFEHAGDFFQHRLFAAKQMRHAGGVDPQAVGRDRRNPGAEPQAAGRQLMQRFGVVQGCGGGDRDLRQDGAGLGQGHAGGEALMRCGGIDRDDHLLLPLLGDERERPIRRCARRRSHPPRRASIGQWGRKMQITLRIGGFHKP